jgi:hypothetical protein
MRPKPLAPLSLRNAPQVNIFIESCEKSVRASLGGWLFEESRSGKNDTYLVDMDNEIIIIIIQDSNQ